MKIINGKNNIDLHEYLVMLQNKLIIEKLISKKEGQPKKN